MSKRTFAVLIVVAALALAGTAVVTADNGETGVPTTNNTDPAAAAYVTDDGGVILVSHGDSMGTGTGNLGMNVTEGLVFGNYRQPVETNVTGAFSMAANRSRINASGTLEMPRPDALKSLDLTIDSTTTAETSKSSLALDTTVALPPDARQLTMLFEAFNTSGSATMTGSTLRMTGSANWSARLGMKSQEHAFDLRATDDGYVLDARQSYTVSSTAAERWNTREKAVESLSSQFSMIATMINGSSEFTMDAYNFTATENGGHLEVEYTVELQGIEDFIRQSLVESLSGSTSTGGMSMLSTGESTTEDLDVSLDNVSIERVSVAIDVNQGTATEMGTGSVSWNVTVEGYDQLALAYMDALERATNGSMIANQTDRIKAQFAAMQAAGLTRTATWDVSVETMNGSVQVDASMHQRTDNWDAYVAERDARGLPPIGTQRFTFDAATEGDQVVMSGSFRLEQDSMYNRTLRNLARSFEQSSSVTTPMGTNPFSTLLEAKFLGSRLDASINESVMTVDGYAEFGNLSAITGMVDQQVGAGSIEAMYVTVSGDTPTTYLRLENVVESGTPDETVLREHAMIGENTTIYLSGEWDAVSRTVTVDGTETRMMVPQANDDAQQENDGTQTTEPSPDESTDNTSDNDTTTDGSGESGTVTTDNTSPDSTDASGGTTTTSGPGFGAVVGIVALLAVALVASRRY